MPVNATPTTPLVITSDDVRFFMRDVAGEVPGTGADNILWDKVEFSDDDIARAVRFTVARFNVMTPLSNDTVDTINPWLLLVGCAEFLMHSESFRQLRNQLTYGDGDVAPIGLDDKMQLYQGMADKMKAEFEEKSKAFKISRNAESAYGSLGSGYRAVARFLTGH